MSIWFREAKPQAEERALSFAGDWWRPGLFGATQPSAHVDASLIENAQQSVAVAAAVDLIASICSELPIDYYSGQGAGRKSMAQPAYLDDPAGDGYGLQDWIYQLVWSWCYRGNIYGDILARARAGQGFIQQMTLLHPDHVSGWLEEGKVIWSAQGLRVPDGRLYHKRVNPVPEQIVGLSPIARNATQVGISLAATRFGKAWFDSDANPTGILRNTLGAVDGEKAKTIKDRFMAALRGTREPIVMGRGWEWQSVSVTPEESQFLQTMGYSEAQCARLFGPGIPEILGYESGGTMTYSNVQDRDIQLLKYSVNRWLRRVERVLYDFLPRPQYAVFNRDALLETNTMLRYQAYALATGNKPWKSVNDVRELENLKPVDGGDEVVAAPPPEPDPADDPAAEEDPPADPNEDDPEDDSEEEQ